jgi:uncharacterized protein (DUF885 family)
VNRNAAPMTRIPDSYYAKAEKQVQEEKLPGVSSLKWGLTQAVERADSAPPALTIVKEAWCGGWITIFNVLGPSIIIGVSAASARSRRNPLSAYANIVPNISYCWQYAVMNMRLPLRARIFLGVVLLSLLSGCFQAQVYGPVAAASFTVSDLRDEGVIHIQLGAPPVAATRTIVGEERWDDLGATRQLWLVGIVQSNFSSFEDDALYLVTASGGEDTDADGDGQINSSYAPVDGRWHAILTGAQLKSRGVLITPLSEALYQWLLEDIPTLTDAQIRINLDAAAQALVVDIDSNGHVDSSDVLVWSRFQPDSAFLGDLATLNQIADTVMAYTPQSQRRQLAQSLVGLEPRRDGAAQLSAATQLEEQLRGLALADFFSAAHQALSLRDPEDVVADGLAENYGLHSLRLTKVADDYAHDTYAMNQVVLDHVLAFDRSSVSSDEQLSLTIYQWYLQDILEGEQYLLYSYPASSFITGLPRKTEFFFSNIHPLATGEDIENYVTRLGFVATKMEEVLAKVQVRAATGIIEPAITLAVGIQSLREVSRAAYNATGYYQTLDTALRSAEDISAEQSVALKTVAKQVIEGQIQPAYQSLVGYLESIQAQAPQAIGMSQFAGGAEYYRYALRHHTTSELTPAQVHQTGLDELSRLHAEMRSLGSSLGYGSNASIADLRAQTAIDGGGFSGSAIRARYEAILETSYQRLPEAFDLVPQQELVVIGSDFGGFYVSGSQDGTRPGAFYAATVGDEDYYTMPTLAYHEGVPGHHLQIALAREQALPDFRRFTNYSAFVEGWALYAERLAADLGWYAQDPYGDMGRLEFEAIRAARLVMDTGIHDLGWSWDQAVAFWEENTGSSLSQAQGAVARFMRWPGQATAYMIGMNKFLELREVMQLERGANYDIRDYHNLVLNGAAMPLTILEDVVYNASN